MNRNAGLRQIAGFCSNQNIAGYFIRFHNQKTPALVCFSIGFTVTFG